MSSNEMNIEQAQCQLNEAKRYHQQIDLCLIITQNELEFKCTRKPPANDVLRDRVLASQCLCILISFSTNRIRNFCRKQIETNSDPNQKAAAAILLAQSANLSQEAANDTQKLKEYYQQLPVPKPDRTSTAWDGDFDPQV